MSASGHKQTFIGAPPSQKTQKQGPLDNLDSNTGIINVAQAICGGAADDARQRPKPG
jgi:hypothetical protein